jgi:two-component system, NtrC family, nitrogen regulation sensor histidine kinase NtrY
MQPSPAPKRQVRRNALAVAVLSVLLAAFTALQAHLRDYDFPNVVLHAVFNLNFVLLLTLLVLLGRNLFKLNELRRSPRAPGALPVRLVLYSLGLVLPITLLSFISLSETLIAVVEKWFEPSIDRMLDDALDAAQGSLRFVQERADQAAQALLQQTEPWPEPERWQAEVRQQGLAGAVLRSAGCPTRSAGVDPAWKAPPELVPDERLWVPLDRGDALFHVSRSAPDRSAEVIVTLHVPVELDALSRSVVQQVADYKQSKRIHVPVRKSYVMGLGLVALAALFSATWAAFKVAGGISAPISTLAAEAQAIAEGRDGLEPRAPTVLGHGAPAEIHTLVRSFEHMRQTLRERGLQLEDAHRRMQTVLSDISAGVLALDGDGRVTLANRQAEAMLGLSEGAPRLPPTLTEMLALVQRGGGRAGPTEIQIDQSGGRRILSATVSPLETEQGSAVVVLEDLTELIQAQCLAAWREAARRVAHEIKNPLTPIQLSAQRLRRRSGELPQPLRGLVEECAETIVEEVDTMRRLVSDFSQFARLPRAQPVQSDLNGLVRAVAKLYQEDGTVQVELSPQLPSLLLDPDLIRQVLINLVKNGLEATGGRGPVHLSTTYQASQGAVRLTVADGGPGIEPETRDKLFLPYFSTKREGTGLGLTIVHQIVADHAGHVRVRSAPGQGTAVVVELPVAR